MTVETPLAPRRPATLHATAPLRTSPPPAPAPLPSAVATAHAPVPGTPATHAPAAHAAHAAQPHAAAQPRRVRATAPATGFSVEALLQPALSPPSILDVDPRLLVVRRTAPPAATTAHRSLAAPIDERREHRSHLRRRVLTAVGGASAVLVSAASVGLALA